MAKKKGQRGGKGEGAATGESGSIVIDEGAAGVVIDSAIADDSAAVRLAALASGEPIPSEPGSDGAAEALAPVVGESITDVITAPVPAASIGDDQLAPVVERLRAGKCVLIVGSGLEAAVGLPTFRQMLEQLLAALDPSPEVAEARKILEHRPFVTAGFVRRHLGDRFNVLLQAASLTPRELPEAIKSLGALPFRAVVTTSYSDLFQRAFTKDGAAPAVLTPTDAASIKQHSRQRFVLMALGDPRRENTVLFTWQEIQKALHDDAYRSAIHDLYRNRTILFLGFTAADIDLFFGRLFAGVQSDAVHFAVVPSYSAVEAEDLEDSLGIRTLGSSDLGALVERLRAAVGDVDFTAPPDDDDLEGWLEVLANEPGRQDARAKLAALEARLRDTGDVERQIELHLGMVEHEPKAGGRARRLREVARLFESGVGDLGKAFTALVAAYKEEHAPEIMTELERLAGAAGLWTELIEEIVDSTASLPESARPDAWFKIAKLYTDKLGHDEYALTALDEALKLLPEYMAAEDLRIELLRKSGKWKMLAESLGVRAAHEIDPAKKSEMYLEQGDVYESHLSDGPSAAQAYQSAIDAEPINLDALNALEHLHRRRGEFAALVGVLDKKAASASDKTALRKEAAQIAAEKLGDRKAAIERYEALRADDDKDLAVLKALEALYEAEGRIDDYFDVLAAQAEAVKDDKERVALFRRLGAEWEERPSGSAKAAEWYERVLSIEPRAEDALRAVERLYALDKKWEALVDAYRRHADLPGADKRGLAIQVAKVFEEEINDATRAVGAWEAVLGYDEKNDMALAALVRLEKAREDWPRVVELLESRAELAQGKDARVNLIHEAGRVTVEKLGDAKAGEARFAKALGIDATHVQSMLALVELYRKAGEFVKAAKLLVEAEGHTQNRLEKTRILVEAGEIHDSLDDAKTAADLYLKALAVDPEHVEAGARVAELLWKAERWADLVPVLEMLTRKESDKETTKQRLLRLGQAAKATEQKDKALRAWTRVAELDPTDLVAQRERAALFFADGKFAEARDAFAAVLAHHRDDMMPRELLELFFHLGECDRHLGHLDKAKNFYQKALEIDPHHRPTILAQIDAGTEDPRHLVEAKKALLTTASKDESVTLLTQIGELEAGKLGNAKAALAAYKEALALKPDSRQLLHRCLDIFVEEKDWQQALEMLERLTNLEQVPSVRAKLKFTRAMIHKDELLENDAAVKLLNEALDDEWTATPAPTVLEGVLEKSEQWKDLTRLYRKAIKRLPVEVEGDSPELRKERLRLWSKLGEITLDKLAERQSALAALEVAATLDRDSVQRKEQLAELYVEAGPDHVDKAIQTHQALLRGDHNRIASYRALRQLYAEARQNEKALAVAYALSFLKKGDPSDAPMVAEAKQRPLVPVRRNLDDENWLRNVVHPDENPYLDALFAQLTPSVAIANGRAHKDLGLNRKEKIEANDPRSFAKGLRYVSAAIDAKLQFETYVKYDARAGLAVFNAVDKSVAVPCVVVGGPMLGDKRGEREMIYEITKQLAHLRSERYLRNVLGSPSMLGALVDAAIALATEADGKPVAGDAAKKAQELKRALPPKVLEQVVFFGRKFKGQRGEPLAAAWLAATELTATRAAFLLLGDLEATARMVAADPPSVSTHPPLHRLKELIWFSITEECFAAKRHLGLMA